MVRALVKALGVKGASQLQQLQISLGLFGQLLSWQVKPLLASSLGSELSSLPIQTSCVPWCQLELQGKAGNA